MNGEAVAQLADIVAQTAPEMQKAADRIAALPKMHIEQLSSKLEPMLPMVAQANEAYQLVGKYAPVLRGLLGVDGERTYLIVAQNSAEIRACGGFPGAIGALYVDNGKISMGDFGTPYDLLTDDYPEGLEPS